MRIKKLLSIILCFVFVMSLFPFSAAAESGLFLTKGNKQDIWVSEAVYEEQSNKMMSMQYTGYAEGAAIKGLLDLKTSHEFPVETGTLEVTVPKEVGEGNDIISCEVSFVPSIIEGDTPTPFFTAVALDQESIFTIRDNDIYVRAVIENDDISIEYPELLDADVTISPEYGEETDIYYDIIYRVDFYATDATATPNKLIGELQHTVRVYDSPLLGVEINYDEQISSHYGYEAAYIEEDIWNSTVQVNIKRESGEDEIGNRTEPVEGVLTNIFYYWGASDNKYCTFKPTEDGVLTNADGIAEFTGEGLDLIEREIGIPAQALYGKLEKALANDLSQYYTYPDLKGFEGILKVKVVNTEREPLKGRNVQIWGGVKYDHKAGAETDDQGIATIRYPSTTISTDVKELTMTELPTFSLKWNVTQVIDNPERIVDGHNAPLYLSPEIYVSEGYSKNPYTEIRGVRLQVYDVENPDKVLIETSPRAFKEKYDERRDIVVRGAHRAYIKISPQDWKSKKLGIRAVVPNKDEGVREEYQVRGYVEDKTSTRELYVPKKTFTFAFVPLRVGSEENNSSVSYGGLSPQKEYIRKIFPAPVKFVEKSPMFIAKPRFSTHNMYLSRILRELDRTQKLFSNKYDLLIGMTPRDFLGAAGLQDSGMFGMNWSFLGAAHGAVLIDPSQVLPHTTLHEIIHTLGLGDVYSEDGVQLQSANGHDGTPINNVPGKSPANEPIMYDHANAPWPTEGEYNALLEYATKPASGKMSLLSMSAFSEASQPEVLLLSGSIEDIRSNQRKVDFDTIIKHTGVTDENSDYDNNGYVIQTLASDKSVLSQYFFSDYEYEGKYYAKFIANLPAANVQAIEIGKQEYGSITQIFQRYEYSPSVPAVSFTGPATNSLSGDFIITWEASDTDKDALRSEVQVSSDGGNTWNTIASNIPDNTSGNYSYTVNAKAFLKGENYKFKVVVTDGMYSAEAVSGKVYIVEGYEPKPVLNLPNTEATIKVKSGVQAATAYFELSNSGKEELYVELSPDNEASTFVSPLFIKEYTIYPGQKQLIAVPLILPGNAESTLMEVIRLQPKDSDNPTTNLRINVEYTEDDLKPELASVSTNPSDFSGSVSDSPLQVIFEAYAAAGQSSLEATVIIEDNNGIVIADKMAENYHKPGAYTYYWEHEGLPAGNYGVYIGLKDTQSGLERVRTEGEYDFTFNIKVPNEPPVFTNPNTYETNLGVVNRGEKVTIPYEVSDPDGDALDINVFSNLSDHGLVLFKDTGNSGRIEWTANISGVHSIYLTATDSSENSAEVMFNIVEAEDLNVYAISLEANSSEGGQVYGSGLYNPGENVTVEAVPGESYKFINWTEDGIVVSTDAVYTFEATKDRKLVANFEEAVILNYEIEDGKVIITGFADEPLEDIVISNEIMGYPVTEIRVMAFWSKGIKSVKLPETLTNIGANAFHSNQLTEIIIPNSVTAISDGAFGFNEDLVKAVIRNGDTTLGEGVFSGCSPDLVIYGVPGSSVNTYATENSITFEAISEYETYDVIINGGGSGAAGAGNYAVNDIVTINAGNRSGYTFNGWTSADVTFADAGAQTTTFTMPARNVAVTATWKAVSGGSSGGSNNSGNTTGSLPQQEENNMGTETTTGTMTRTLVDGTRLESYLETAEMGSGILIPISENETSGAQLPLNAFESMAEKEITLTILSGAVAIDIPSTSIDTGAIKELLGPEGNDGEISISITIAQPSSGEAASLQAAAESEGLGMLGAPVVFNITASYNGKTVEVASFKQYVQRRLEVDQDIADNVTTALVFEADNTFRPVPTSVYHEGGKHYVIVNSRTNSTYVLVSQNTSFSDTQGKWYKDIVKEMADRQIIRGMGNNTFAGDREITRAEFAAIIIRALGLPAKGNSEFSDVAADNWYNQTVAAATQYGIVSGKGNNLFDPLANITREEAMQIIFNASKLVPIDGVNESVDSKAYSDYNAKSQWAAEAVDFNLNNGLIIGSKGKINPKANITRGEAATVILRLLRQSNLVDIRD